MSGVKDLTPSPAANMMLPTRGQVAQGEQWSRRDRHQENWGPSNQNPELSTKRPGLSIRHA